MIHSKQHRGCRIQDPGTRGYWWWKTADFSHSARCAPYGALQWAHAQGGRLGTAYFCRSSGLSGSRTNDCAPKSFNFRLGGRMCDIQMVLQREGEAARGAGTLPAQHRGRRTADCGEDWRGWRLLVPPPILREGLSLTKTHSRPLRSRRTTKWRGKGGVLSAHVAQCMLQTNTTAACCVPVHPLCACRCTSSGATAEQGTRRRMLHGERDCSKVLGGCVRLAPHKSGCRPPNVWKWYMGGVHEGCRADMKGIHQDE